MTDNLGVLAGGVAFYGFLSVFPAIAGALMVWGLFDGGATVGHIDALRDLAPGPAFELIATQMSRIANQGTRELTQGLAVTVIVALWSASRGVVALMSAMNMAYHEREKRGFVRVNGMAIGFTLAAALFAAISFALVAAVPPILEALLRGAFREALAHMVRWLLMLVIFLLASAALYRFGPSRAHARWRWILPGAALASLIWLAASLVFSLYIANFNAYNATFGSLGAVAALLMWFWLSAYAICMGAELNSQLELFTREDTTTGPPQAPGKRGAFVADHVDTPETGGRHDDAQVKIPKQLERTGAEKLGSADSTSRKAQS